MDDFRVLVFFYIVEGSLVGFVGLALIGIRLSWKQFLSIGILQGLVVYLVRGFYALNNIPFGTHTFLAMVGLIIILKVIARKSWGISSVAALLGFVVTILSEGLMFPIILKYMTMTYESIVMNVWRHIMMGYCGSWLLFLVAIYLGITKKALIRVENLDS